MEKQRVILYLDPEVVAALKRRAEGQSLSATANEVLGDALGVVDYEARRRAMLEWMEELNEKYGYPTAEDYAWADAVLDEACGLRDSNDEVPRTDPGS